MATIKCTKCGTKIANVTSGSIVCPNCGHKMKYVPKKTTVDNLSTEKNVNDKKKKTSNIITQAKTQKSEINTEHATKATEHPQQPKKKKTKGYLKGCFTIFAIFILFSIYVGLSEEKENERDKNVTHRESMYNTNQKDIDDIDKNLVIASVRNDTTGKWKLARIADNIDIEEYALSYYNKYFENDDEIHAIVNFTNRTTTKISVLGDMLDVEIHEYIDKEEHDANVLFSGMIYDSFLVHLDNGDIEKKGDIPIEENSSVDATPENFINDVRNAIDGSIATDESILDVRLENGDLCVFVDLGQESSQIPIDELAMTRTSSITDSILSLNGYDDLWETITIDFANVGKIRNDKSNIGTSSIGRYFYSENFVLE